MNYPKTLRAFAVAAVAATALVIHACTTPLTIEDVLIKPTTMSAVGPTTFTATAGTVVQNPARVRVLDQQNAAMANQIVSFTASRGTLSSATASTNEQGEASPASWTAPNQAGSATITASIPGESVGSVVFTATVTAAAPATQTKTATTDNQSAIAGSALTTNAPEVNVADQFGNGVSGVTVTFTILTGGGTINGTTATTANVTTDANGKAKLTSWVLGTAVGTNTLRATTSVLPGQALTFTATGTVGPVNKIVIAPPGNSQNQSAVGGSNVNVPPAVLVTDANNNPISGASVLFTVATGGGKVLANSGDATGANSLQVTTNASGIATIFGWKLGSLGANSLTVTSPGATGVTFTINATATAGPPATIAVVVETPSSNNPTPVPVGTVTSPAPGVVVKDANGNVVANTSVTFTVGANSGTIKTTSAGSEVTTGTVTTDVNGVARLFSWKLGNRGANTLTAAVTSNTSLNVTFNATGTAGPPASITIVEGNNQSTIANTATTVAPKVLVKDANNLTVDAGHNISFTITSGGGVVSATGCTGSATTVTVATDANGVAVVGCWKPGTVGAGNTLRAAVVATPAIFVNFTATGTVGPPTQIAFTNQPWQFTQQGTTNGGVPKVTVKDVGGNGVSGQTVNWTNGGNANSTVGGTTSSTTDASGVAQFGGSQGGTWTAAVVASGSTMTLQAAVAATSLTASTTSTVVGPPASTTTSVGAPASTTVNTVVTPTPVIVVRDGSGRQVPKIAVTWGITANPGGSSPATLTGAPPQSDSVGQANPGSWKVASTAGTNTIQATIAGLGPHIFTTAGVAGAASQIAINAGNGQSANTGQPVTTPPSVVVRDQFNNLVGPGVSVTFSPTAGSGSVTGSPANTNASGVATVGSWTLGSTPGTQTLNAFITSTPSATVAITATAIDPCEAGAIAHTIGTNVNGTLASTDCNVAHRSGTGTQYADVYRITVPASTTRYFRAQLSSSAFGPEIRSYVYLPINAYWFNNSTTPATLASFLVLGPGTHDILATSEAVTTTGAYNFVTDLNPAIPAGSCGNFVTTKNVSVGSHTLATTDCKYDSNAAGTTETPSRRYLLYLPAGQTATVNVSGAVVDWYLEAYDLAASPATFITFVNAGTSGLAESMVIPSSGSSRFIEIRVTHSQSNVPPPGTYPYTFSINP